MIKKKSFNDEKLKIIGSRLRNFRRDISIRKFAQEMEITYSRIGYIECGLIEPTLNEISKYQKKFNVSYDYLLGLTDESTIDIKIKDRTMEENKYENKYENIIARYTEKQLVYERVILLKQFNTIKKQLALLDEEFKRRLEK